MKVFFIYFWILFEFYFKILKRKFRKDKLAIEVKNAEKECIWIDLDRYKIKYIKVSIGPHMSIPEIQRIFRFINNHDMNVILVLEGDPWKNKGSEEYIDAYLRWYKHILNTLQIPHKVKYIQILDNSWVQRDWYINLIDAICNIPQNLIHPSNRRHLQYSGLGCFHPLALSSLLFENFHGSNQSFFEVKNRIIFLCKIFKFIKILIYFKDNSHIQNFIFSSIKTIDQNVQVEDLYLISRIFDLIFKDKCKLFVVNEYQSYSFSELYKIKD